MRLFRTPTRLDGFEYVIMPHLKAAYNLARWLTRNEQDAEDLVQEAYLRAFKFFDSFHGEDGRVWLLKIVRNTFYSRLPRKREQDLTEPFDESLHDSSSEGLNPEILVIQNIAQHALKQALVELPAEYREVIILRELEELTYKEIASLTGLPLGTVMSRLARARKKLQQYLKQQSDEEGRDDL